jgi:hypothetical protein
VRFLRKLLGETDALDEAVRGAGGDVHAGEVDAPDAPTLPDEPADLPEDQREEEEPTSR